MSNDVINAPASETEALPASTPEYAPAVQTIVEDVKTGETTIAPVETPSAVPPSPNAPELAPTEPLAVPVQPSESPLPSGPPPIAPDVSPESLLYKYAVEVVSRSPQFELHNNMRQMLEEVRHLRSGTHGSDTGRDDLAVIRETVQHIWTRIQDSGFRIQDSGATQGEIAAGSIHNRQSSIVNPEHLNTRTPEHPTQELITETRALARAVQKEIDAVRNNTIQLQNQMQIVMGATTECLREMDKTARRYEPQEQTDGTSETSALVDQLRSLRDMLAVKFENARLEPIAPEPGDTFRLNEHRADNGFASTGKIKRTVFEGFRWTQPNPPVVLLPAIVETE